MNKAQMRRMSQFGRSPADLGAMRWGGKTRLERFWEKVERRSPDECWVWQASCAQGRKGAPSYGQLVEWRPEIRSTDGGSPRPLRAHVLSWAIHHNRWPAAGEVVRHSCDNPPCVNPAHLLIGTHLQNTKDARERKRNPIWVACDEREDALHKEVVRLGERRAEIANALRRYPQPSASAIARELGVSRQAIEQQLNRMEDGGYVRRVEWVMTIDLVPELRDVP